MQQRSNTPSQQPSEERNALVLALLEHVTPILRKSARAYRLDYDDLYQDASIIIMHMLDSNQVDFSRETAYHYVRTRIKSRIVNMLRYASRRRAASLDAPISQDEDSFTLADLLPSTSSMQPDATLIAQEDIEEAFLWVPDFPSSNTRRALRWLGETAAASLVGGAV
jgi:DNA-directed RNA polymerase specialized sigma24 family protein